MATVTKTPGLVEVQFDNGKTVRLKPPDRSVLSQCLAISIKDPLGPVDVLVSRCLLEKADKKLFELTGYCHQLIRVMDDIFGKVSANIEFVSRPENIDEPYANVIFQDGEEILLSLPTRKDYTLAKTAAKTSPLYFAEHLLKNCWVEGNKQIMNNPGYLLGFSEVADEILNYTGDSLGN